MKMKTTNMLAAVLAVMAGSAYAADFTGLQTFRAADVAMAAEAYKVTVPAPIKEIAVSEKAESRLKTAVLKISGYSERELDGKLLNANELADLTNQLNYIAALPSKDIPVELLGYLEGISLSIQELLPRGPAGRNIGPAMKAARALRAKVAGINVGSREGLSTEKGLTVLKEQGQIRTCTTRYSAGFADTRVENGYCVGNIFFLKIDNYTPPSVAKALAAYAGQSAVLKYEPYANNVGCNLVAAAQHPVECSVKSSYNNIELLVNGKNILPLLH